MSFSLFWFVLFVVALFIAGRYRSLWQSAEESRSLAREVMCKAVDAEQKTTVKYEDLLISWRRWRSDLGQQIKRLEGELAQVQEVLDRERATWEEQKGALRRELIETQDYAIRAGRAVIEKSN